MRNVANSKGAVTGARPSLSGIWRRWSPTGRRCRRTTGSRLANCSVSSLIHGGGRRYSAALEVTIRAVYKVGVQGHFQAMMMCLGKVLPIKHEDSGAYHFDDSDG